jgi:hypothetical protein
MPSWILQVGTGGAFLLVALFIIGKFYLPKRAKGGTHCINTSQAREAMDNNKSMKETLGRLESTIGEQVKEQVETTLVLRLIHEESKAQTTVLREVARNGKR